MSFFNLFGKRKQKSKSPLEVIQSLNQTIKTLEKRETFLEKNMAKYRAEAKACVKTNKNKAILLLKKAKRNEKQLESIYGQKNNLEMQIFAIQQGIATKDIVTSMKEGKNAIEKMTKNLDVDDIGDLMDDISSTLDITNEIASVMSQQIGEEYDDEKLLVELDNEINTEITKKNDDDKINDELRQLELMTEPKNDVRKREDSDLQELEKMMNIVI